MDSLLIGLLEYHKLDLDYSDASGNGNTANNFGTTIVSGGIINNAADFNSTYLRSAVTPGSVGSISIWFKYDAFVDAMIIGNTTIGTSDWLRFRPISDTSIQVVVRDEFFTPTVAPLGTSWHHATLAWDSASIWKAYLDGSVIATGTTAKNPTNANTIPFGVLGNGTGIWSAPFYFDGKMDEIGIWNRQITKAEVTRLYNGGIGLTYPFTSLFIPKILIS